jgi:hypothetical protein
MGRKDDSTVKKRAPPVFIVIYAFALLCLPGCSTVKEYWAPRFDDSAGAPAPLAAAREAGAEEEARRQEQARNPQTAAVLEAILESRELTCAAAADFVLQAAGVIAPGARGEDAYEAARERGWLPAGAQRDDPIKLSGLSLLIMRSFGLRGGILYSLFHNSRYAYREMRYQELIQGETDPGENVSGTRMLLVLGRVLSQTGDS